MTKWFRFYASVLGDQKVQRLPAALFRSWVNTLCVASQAINGIIPPLEEYAYLMRLSKAEAHELLQTLRSKELLDSVDGKLRPHNWDRRQYKSDVSTARAKLSKQRSLQRSLQHRSNGVSDIQTIQTIPLPLSNAPDLSEIALTIFNRHCHSKRGGGLPLIEQYIVDQIGNSVDPGAEAARMDRNHAARCAEWADMEPRFITALTKWISSGDWTNDPAMTQRYEPPGPVF